MSDLEKAGYHQGEMSPKVEDYQKSDSEFSQSGHNDTLNYIGRQDAHQKAGASKIKGQEYVGRYS
jgi:hypothetical protein